MPAIHSITAEKLSRLIGLPAAPAIIDVREEDAFARDRRMIPGAFRRDGAAFDDWARGFTGRSVVLACDKGGSLSHGIAARLRCDGIPAEALEGGVSGWAEASLPLVEQSKLPPRDAQGRTAWVTRARPKVDRIACPWLIRRFVDPSAIILFVPTPQVPGVAKRFNAAPFDIEGDGVLWSHRGELCTFDVMVEELGLKGVPGLQLLATIVRGADTARPEIAPQAAGLLAVSLGLSRMFAEDAEQLEAGLTVYDAFYRWCRDAVDETHDWISHTPKPRGPRG